MSARGHQVVDEVGVEDATEHELDVRRATRCSMFSWRPVERLSRG